MKNEQKIRRRNKRRSEESSVAGDSVIARYLRGEPEKLSGRIVYSFLLRNFPGQLRLASRKPKSCQIRRSSNMALQLSRFSRSTRGTAICNVCQCRGFGSSSILFSGHNKWSTIKHDKARNDKAKSKERQMVSKEISNATQCMLSSFLTVLSLLKFL